MRIVPVNVPRCRDVSTSGLTAPPLDMTAGRIGALRRQSAATLGEGLQSCFVLRWLRTAGMVREGECSAMSRPFDFATLRSRWQKWLSPRAQPKAQSRGPEGGLAWARAGRTGECSVSSGPFDFAIAPLKVTDTVW